MNPGQLSLTIIDVLEGLVADGTVTLPQGVPTTVTVERPRQQGHGDYATNVALQLAKQASTNPRALAELVSARLAGAEGVAGVEVAGPGFLNITVDAGSQGQVAAEVLAAGDAYGHSQALAGQSVNIEFISANPTGPLHLGHTRWAVLGDAIARVLQAAGAQVAREFYINDRGNQMDLFGASLEAAALGRPIPEDGYQGAYVADLAARIVAERPEILDLPAPERLPAFREAGYALQLREQQDQLDGFNTHFDVWFSERALHAEGSDGSVADTLQGLKDNGHLFESDGALWMRTTDFGDDKDRVLIRSNGELTYFASDTAYYLNKRARGFDHCIYLLGADHHGYVGRLRAMAACVGDDPALTLDVMIGQLVKIMRDGEELRLSKRAGTIVTLTELVDEIGVDALRYSLARYPADSPLDARRRRDHQGVQRQPRLLRAVRPRPDLPDDGERRRPRGDPARGRLRPVAARPRAGRPAAPRAGRVPPGGRQRRRAARAAPHRPLPRGHGRGLQQVVRHQGVPDAAAGRRAGGSGQRGAPRAGGGHADGRSPTASTCSASPRPSGCDPACPPRTRPAGPTPTAPSARSVRAGRTGCVSPATPTRWSRSCGRRPRPRTTAC